MFQKLGEFGGIHIGRSAYASMHLCVNIHRQKRARALSEWENLLDHLFTCSNTYIFMRLRYFMYLPEQTQHRTLLSC